MDLCKHIQEKKEKRRGKKNSAGIFLRTCSIFVFLISSASVKNVDRFIVWGSSSHASVFRT